MAWTKIDLSIIDNPPSHLEKGDHCWYLRDYLVDRSSDKKPWELSTSNKIIGDFKIKPEKLSNQYLRNLKLVAIELFAQELSRNVKKVHSFASIPGSKRKDDPGFDNRLDLMLLRAQQINTNVHIVNAICRTATMDPSHSKGGSRSPSDHMESLAAVDPIGTVVDDVLFLVDDVLTSGATFKACQTVIRRAYPKLTVCGLFWARRKLVDPLPTELDLDSLFPKG